MRVGFQLSKSARNLKRPTIIKIGLLSRITLNFTKEDFYGVTGFLSFNKNKGTRNHLVNGFVNDICGGNTTCANIKI